ncbi:hypothetical protein CONCODRAFT_8539 [Conidiobolus coronatus NRRL 28638]|uniref:Uncharacterized protein n=1 Tax=Conidiobolus coronatus (strain ATCC 28846 / CBS 209.66 / NRRL 28638) TaxID=796925 RepID=A0A137P259_CONC2|nr:hypothetical protein CONCODRAFT_8539 [Conidiobolus coronatus NRRL 28638]|eukprot:KXN69102.1 hypothetical protein CONCODRAFT_8539 [Conidiobolus coronatus NRRL 28638]
MYFNLDPDANNANSITNPSEISLEKYNQLAHELRLREEEVKTQKNLINFYEFNLKNCLNEFYFKLLKIKANSVNNSYNNHHIQNLVNENLMLKGYIDQFKQHLVELMELDSEEANVDELVDKLAEVNSQNINAQNAELVQLREENEALRYLLGISSDPNLEGFSEDQLQTLTKQLIEGIEKPEN